MMTLAGNPTALLTTNAILNRPLRNPPALAGSKPSNRLTPVRFVASNGKAGSLTGGRRCEDLDARAHRFRVAKPLP
jgi:hypothetical protein